MGEPGRNMDKKAKLQEINKKAYEHYGSFSKYATREPEDSASIRFYGNKTNETLRRPFAVDVDKIMNNPFYNRYGDKTQVFSFFRNDEITRFRPEYGLDGSYCTRT